MLRQGKSIDYVTIRFYAHFKPGANRHHANDFEARIRAFEVADGCGFSACEGTRTAPVGRECRGSIREFGAPGVTRTPGTQFRK